MSLTEWKKDLYSPIFAPFADNLTQDWNKYDIPGPDRHRHGKLIFDKFIISPIFFVYKLCTKCVSRAVASCYKDIPNVQKTREDRDGKRRQEKTREDESRKQ